MKKVSSIISATALAVSVLGTVPIIAGAEETESLVYGTMNIPYADFYKAELSGSTNEYEVDAISSATTSKWSKNGAGELFEGTFNEANEDGTGTILGVTYPVAITQSDLDSLGDNNYSFTAIEYVPSAYKIVTVEDGAVSFSELQDETPVTANESLIKLSTNTPWGDYLIDIENAPEMGAIYGALIKTTDGNSYAMWHEANIWRGELAWSSGIKRSEPHGNNLPYENFVSLMGSTINEVVFITLDGYTIIETDTYIPVKFEGEFVIENGISGTGSTNFTANNVPEDYERNYSIADNFTVTDEEIAYTDALAGSYTLTVSDNAGKYADVTADFVLTTDSMPAVYSDGAIVKAEGADDSDFANFLKNISVVSVNGTEYSASGRGSIKIIGDDGTIDTEVSSRDSKVFDSDSTYHILVQSTGYNSNLEFEFETGSTSEEESTSTAPNDENQNINNSSNTSSNNTTTSSSSTNKNNNTTSANNSSSNATASPKTGVKGVAVPVTLMLTAGAVAFVVKKKNK
ncbi:MAG: NPXTG-anchored protein [Ruminococcus sp.]|nr:NPXTG-anchored protein [Ruminococcus sp.]